MLVTGNGQEMSTHVCLIKLLLLQYLHFLDGHQLGNWCKWSQLCLSGQDIQSQGIFLKISSLDNEQWFVLLFLYSTHSIGYLLLYYCYLLCFGCREVTYKSHITWTAGQIGVWGGHSNLLMAFLLLFHCSPPVRSTRDFQINLSRGQFLSSGLSRIPKWNNFHFFNLTFKVLHNVMLNLPFQFSHSLRYLPSKRLILGSCNGQSHGPRCHPSTCLLISQSLGRNTWLLFSSPEILLIL